MRAKRRSLATHTRSAQEKQIEMHLLNSNIWRETTTVAAYLASDGEVDLRNVIVRLREMNKKIAVPMVYGRDMRFVCLDAETQLKVNRFGIQEPVDSDTLSSDQFDVVLTPLVGFTNEGDRIGRGGGYYDRYFRTRGDTLLIGIAYGFQEVNSMDRKETDQPLDAVVTEAGWTLFSDASKTRLEISNG